MSIEVIDQSEAVEAEIGWGTDLRTGKTVVSVFFEPEIKIYPEDLTEV